MALFPPNPCNTVLCRSSVARIFQITLRYLSVRRAVCFDTHTGTHSRTLALRACLSSNCTRRAKKVRETNSSNSEKVVRACMFLICAAHAGICCAFFLLCVCVFCVLLFCPSHNRRKHTAEHAVNLVIIGKRARESFSSVPWCVPEPQNRIIIKYIL